jgi:uncharacterized membrane-anchored protein
VAAISYYVVGLIGYTAKGAKVLGVAVNPELLMGVMVPVVAVGMWLGLRSMHKRLHHA